MTNFIDHTPDLRAVLTLYGLIELGQTKTGNHGAMLLWSTYRTFCKCYLKQAAHN